MLIHFNQNTEFGSMILADFSKNLPPKNEAGDSYNNDSDRRRCSQTYFYHGWKIILIYDYQDLWRLKKSFSFEADIDIFTEFYCPSQ